MNKTISIVMGYYNRKEQLLFTLETILKQYNKHNFDLEIIIVDDASNDENKLEDIMGNYPFKIKLISIDKKDKNWINPVISYNLGIKNCSGDIIIFQNPEVCHLGDIIKHVLGNVNDTNYLVYSVLSLPSFVENNKLFNDYKNTEISQLISDYSKLLYTWYIHPIHNNRRYHFLTAMTRNTLNKIGGFDPNFYDGYWYDDDDFRNRIEKVVNSITFPPESDMLGIHLFHEPSKTFESEQLKQYYTNLNRNRLMRNIKEDIIFCDINKMIPKYNLMTNYSS
jgi:glycosyltransferase involved in cell wall biosynthesis